MQPFATDREAWFVGLSVGRSQRWALQKWLNQSRCHLEPRIRWGERATHCKVQGLCREPCNKCLNVSRCSLGCWVWWATTSMGLDKKITENGLIMPLIMFVFFLGTRAYIVSVTRWISTSCLLSWSSLSVCSGPIHHPTVSRAGHEVVRTSLICFQARHHTVQPDVDLVYVYFML